MSLLLVLLLIQFPPDVQKYVEKANVEVACEADQSSGRSILLHRNTKEKWLVRAFIKNGEPLEVWVNHYVLFRIFLNSVDKVYYKNEEGKWIDKDTLTKQEIDALDARIKFNKDEVKALEKCFEKKLK